MNFQFSELNLNELNPIRRTENTADNIGLAIAGLNPTNRRFCFSILFFILVERFGFRLPHHRQAAERYLPFYKVCAETLINQKLKTLT